MTLFPQDIITGFNSFFSYFQLSPEQAIGILLIPIILDMPRTIGKSLFLLFDSLYIKIVKKSIQSPELLVSVIVPAHNEEQVIERSIQSLLEQRYDKKEIIVVDDGSTDGTYHIANEFALKGLIKLIHRDSSSGKKATALNHGIIFAQGDIIVTIDADTVLEPMSLQKLVEPFSDPKVGAVAGNVRVLNQANLLSKLEAYEYMLSMEMGRRFQAISKMLMIIPGATGAFRLNLVKSIGLYDTDTITEDFDITTKIHKTGMSVKFASDAIGWTTVPDTWEKWLKQRIRWTTGQLQTLTKHKNLFFEPRFGRIGLLAAPDMVLIDIIMLFARTIWLIMLPIFYFQILIPLFSLTLIFYLFSEFVIVLTAAILSPRKHDLVYLPLIPIVVLFYRPLYGLVRMKAYITQTTQGVQQW